MSEPLRVAGVRDPRSVGVHRYVDRLAAALCGTGVDYRASDAPARGSLTHLHLANSSRRVVAQAAALRRPFALTVHDVVPRTPALAPAYRALVHPLVVRRAAAVIVHSAFAARLLAEVARVPEERLHVVAHPAPRTPATREAAREALGLADGPPLFVLPGAIKAAKLVTEAVAAAAPLLADGRLRLLLAGRVLDHATARSAALAGATVLDAPDDARYDAAIAAADAVLVLRDGSVGETNGPLLDAIGAHRPVVATATGSIPETAREAATYVAATPAGIAAGLERLLDPAHRAAHAAAAAERAGALTWEASATEHRRILEAVAG